jgi:hypothetical protein
LDKPCVRGTRRTRRRVHQARAIIPMASSALPTAPAVVPRGRAQKSSSSGLRFEGRQFAACLGGSTASLRKVYF